MASVESCDEGETTLCKGLFPVTDSKTYLLSLKQVLGQIKASYDMLEDVSLVKDLIKIYFHCGPKNASKRILASFLQNAPATDSFQIQIIDRLMNEINACQELLTETNTVRSLVEQMNCLMENFKLGELCLKETRMSALRFLSRALESFVQLSNQKMSPVEKNEAMHHCLATIKIANRMMQKCFTEDSVDPDDCDDMSQIMEKFVRSGLEILCKDDFLTDCRCGVGMMIVLISRLTLGPDYIHIILKSVFKVDINTQSPVIPSVLNFYPSDLSITSLLCLYSGLLPMIDSAHLVMSLPEGGHILTSLFLDKLLLLGDRCVDTGSKVLLARSITLWTSRTCTLLEQEASPKELIGALTGEGHVISCILGYVWSTWDDQLDVLRQNARSTFENCIRIHKLATKSGHLSSDPFIRRVTSDLLEETWSNKGKYGCLGSVVGLMGAAILLELNPGIARDILAQLEEQDLACYASDLYDKVVKAEYKNIVESATSTRNSGQSATPTYTEGQSADSATPTFSKGQTADSATPTFSKGQTADSATPTLSKGQTADSATPTFSKGQSVWLTRWVDPVIEALCGSNKKQKLHIIEYVLPKLFKFSRESLSYMIRTLSNTDEASKGQIGALVMCIRRARALGLLNSPKPPGPKQAPDSNSHDPPPEKRSGDGLWYGLVGVEVLQYALTCADEQVRLDAFALLCENMKTTEPVTQLELSLLMHFLSTNLNNQSPAFRQYLLAYLHKLLARLKESGCTLRRLCNKNKNREKTDSSQSVLHSYTEFLSWLQSELFLGLYPGSAFARRLTCLAGLVTLTEVFSGQEGSSIYECHTNMDPAHSHTLLECLTDTFEENKMAAVKILTYCFSHKALLQTREQVEALFSAAMHLSCSTKPHDCTTASYLLKVLLLQPITVAVMRSHKLDLKVLSANANEEYLGSGDARSSQTANLILLNMLLTSLQDQVAVAKQSLIMAAANRPMYPTMHCIRYILSDVDWRNIPKYLIDEWKSFIARLIEACLDVARVVSPVVQDSSPEGNVPAESIMGPGLNVDAVVQTDEEKAMMCAAVSESERTVTLMPEYLVVCCWRSIKEVSLILGHICLGVSAMLHFQQIESVGQYFTTQLLESKHRGAFELAYAGFVKMCEMLWRSPNKDLHGLPSHWLKEVMLDIISDDPDSRLCATRRSAGVPFYVQALVTTEPISTGRSCFKSAMTKLLQLALQERSGTQIHNPQVHSLNILRALFKDTRLGEDVFPFVADGLMAAILGFKSQAWAVRNSSTLLLSALMTRIFGVKRSKDESAMSKKNCQTGRAFFHRYPSLYQFLLTELTAATLNIECIERLHLHPSLYPVLMVLGRLFPSSLEGADTHLSLAAFIPLVLKCASSPVYKTRLMAARALQPLASKDQLTSLLLELVARLPVSPGVAMRQSYIHGVLLQLEHLLTLVPTVRSSGIEEVESKLLPAWNRVLWLISRENACLTTRKVALEVSDSLVSLCRDSPACETLIDSLTSALQQELDSDLQYSGHTPGLAEFSTALAQLSLRNSTKDLVKNHSKSSSRTCDEDIMKSQSNNEVLRDSFSQERVVLQLLSSEMYEVRLSVLSSLNKSFRRYGAKNSPVVDSGKEGDHEQMTRDEIQRLVKSKEVYSKLLDMALNCEWHHECLALVYEVLYVHPSSIDSCKESNITKIFQQVLLKLQEEVREDVKAAMLQFSSVLLTSVYTQLQESLDPPLQASMLEWCRVLKECSSTEQSPVLQISCAAILKHNAQLLLMDQKHLLDEVSFDLWEIVFDLLQEDDLEVKEVAAEILTSLEPESRHNDLQATVVLEQLLSLMVETQGRRDVAACVSALTSWMTCESDEGKEDEVRLFDKGEMNTYRESLMFVDQCARQLEKLLTGLRETTLTNTGKRDTTLTNTGQRGITLTNTGAKEATLTNIGQREITLTSTSAKETILTNTGQRETTLTNSSQTQEMECVLSTALQKQLDKLSNLKVQNLATLYTETSSYHTVYEAVYRSGVLVRVADTVSRNNEELRTLCDKIQTVIREKFGSHQNYRLVQL